MGKLLRVAAALIGYFCVATVLAETIVAVMAVSQWQIDGDRLAQMIAAAKGITPQPEAPPPEPTKKDDPSREQPSYDDIVQARVAKDLNLQLREQQLAGALVQLRTSQQTLVDDEGRYRKQREQYAAELKAARDKAASAGREQVSDVLVRIKPKQAKALLSAMIDDKELEKAAEQLSAMPEAKRAKILAEFKTDDELKKVREVLRLIEQGNPEAAISDNAKKKLDQSVPGGSAAPPSATSTPPATAPPTTQ